MKNLYLPLVLFFASGSIVAQTSYKSDIINPVYADFAYANPSRDTLFLSIDGNEMGRRTYLIWEGDPNWDRKNPIVLLVPQEFIDQRKSIYLNTDSESNNRSRTKRNRK
jgi:hypothetical protein